MTHNHKVLNLTIKLTQQGVIKYLNNKVYLNDIEVTPQFLENEISRMLIDES